MNILKFHNKLIGNYKEYIKSFINIKDQRILDFLNKKLDDNELWPDPLIQFNPTFEKGDSLDMLIADQKIHPGLAKIFPGYSFYRHQQESIALYS